MKPIVDSSFAGALFFVGMISIWLADWIYGEGYGLIASFIAMILFFIIKIIYAIRDNKRWKEIQKEIDWL